MKKLKLFYSLVLFIIFASLAPHWAIAQEASVLGGNDLNRVVPTGFYFEGRSGQTQMRNAAAVRFGEKRHVIAAMVDTTGYASDVQAKYEGFFITDSKIAVGGTEVASGAYGFGFSKEGKLNLYDLSGSLSKSVAAAKDNELRNPRPLMMVKGTDGVRLYHGRHFVILAAK